MFALYTLWYQAESVVRIDSPTSASGKAVPDLSPWTAAGAPGLGCAAGGAQSPAWLEKESLKVTKADNDDHLRACQEATVLTCRITKMEIIKISEICLVFQSAT